MPSKIKNFQNLILHFFIFLFTHNNKSDKIPRVSSTDGRAYECGNTIGEESPSFAGQSAG